MKEREWNVEVLAAKLREQAAWESAKRAIVLDNVRTGVLEKKFLREANRVGREESGSRATVRGGEGGATKALTATAKLASPPMSSPSPSSVKESTSAKAPTDAENTF